MLPTEILIVDISFGTKCGSKEFFNPHKSWKTRLILRWAPLTQHICPFIIIFMCQLLVRMHSKPYLLYPTKEFIKNQKITSHYTNLHSFIHSSITIVIVVLDGQSCTFHRNIKKGQLNCFWPLVLA